MLKHLGSASVIALTVATGAAAQDHHDHDHDHAHGHHHGDVTLHRVVVGDHDSGRVTVFDLEDPDHRWTFETKGQAKFYPVSDGAAVVAVQSDDDRVDVFTSGITFENHGDHNDIHVHDPAATDDGLDGPRPFHVIDHGGKVSINFDMGGYAEVLDGHELAHGHIDGMRVPQNRAHHGIVVPWGDGWLSSVASDAATEDGAAPPRVGVQAVDDDGEPTGDLATCTAIHGEAFSGAYLAVGCKEGVLTATDGTDGPEYRMLPYPEEFPKGMTTGTLLGSNAIQMFLGNHGADGLVVIDPADEPHMRRIDLPFRRVDFALDPAHPADAYVLTEDGQIHRVNMLKGEIEASAKVTGPYSMDGHWNDARPRLAMAGDEIVVTDPEEGTIHRIRAEDLSDIGTVEVEGTPYNIAVAGGSGVAH